ncbi:hypothetical protein GCM10009754_56960 [Amycolatopsis minnesotensis]|uniref:Uncharacterized protein n=1 Tax=Amycolatopsis minnesotensis TaxID=337894 RepID=A0ABP5D5G4_9PSEU
MKVGGLVTRGVQAEFDAFGDQAGLTRLTWTVTATADYRARPLLAVVGHLIAWENLAAAQTALEGWAAALGLEQVDTSQQESPMIEFRGFAMTSMTVQVIAIGRAAADAAVREVSGV